MITEERLLKIIKKPLITEKTHMIQEKSDTFVFSVVKDANKREIKRAVEMIFSCKVKSVNTLNQTGKAKRTGMRQGRRSDIKKAYVTLVEGQELDFTGAIE